jgi:hypothetical protein
LLSRLKPGYHPKRDAPERPLIGRVALHAEQLVLPHPATGETVRIVAPWPKDLAVAVKYLRRYGPPLASGSRLVVGEEFDQPNADGQGGEEQTEAGEV